MSGWIDNRTRTEDHRRFDCSVATVLTEQDAINANALNMPGELNLVWDKLLPAFHGNTLAENPDELARLKATISKLKASR